MANNSLLEEASFWAGYRHRLDGNKFKPDGYLLQEYRRGWTRAMLLVSEMEAEQREVSVLSEN